VKLSWKLPSTSAWTIRTGGSRLSNTASLIQSGLPVLLCLWWWWQPFPPAAIKDHKVAFWSQEIYMEAIAPLVALLESTEDENFTIKDHSAGNHSAAGRCNSASLIEEGNHAAFESSAADPNERCRFQGFPATTFC